MSRLQFRLSSLVLVLLSASQGAMSATFSIINNCDYTVWPGILSNAGTAQLGTTGFVLEKGESKSLEAPATWSGRFWGRTLCTTDSTGKFTCRTGDCGSSTVECTGGAAPPATLAEFTLDGSGGQDFYDVSLVDGYNLPMLVVPQGAGGSNCNATGCLVELNTACPTDLKVMMSSSDGGSEVVACRSACEAFGSPQYCCSGQYGNPNTCKPSSYSQFFKNACPRAYSYAYDDTTSTFTCTAGAGYAITFCPSTTSQKSDENPEATAGLPLINETMVFLSGDEVSQASASPTVPRADLLHLSVAALLSVVVVSGTILRVGHSHHACRLLWDSTMPPPHYTTARARCLFAGPTADGPIGAVNLTLA